MGSVRSVRPRTVPMSATAGALQGRSAHVGQQEDGVVEGDHLGDRNASPEPAQSQALGLGEGTVLDVERL